VSAIRRPGISITLFLLTLPVFMDGLLVFNAHAEEVAHITDGDSLIVTSGGREVQVRIADIDAPELDQPHGEQAKSALNALVSGREVRLDLISGDAYRRIVARVFVDGRDVAEMLVRDGHAWVRREYAHESALIPFEERARAAKRGLWAESAPVAPWVWRKLNRSRRQGGAGETSPVTNIQCGTKRYCREMTSCQEAFAYLHQCGLKRLDGDNDGIPCENLCR